MNEQQIIRARLAFWPGGQLACLWPLAPEEDEVFWLLMQDGRIAATFWRYRFGMLGGR